jgi:hypothetical protein
LSPIVLVVVFIVPRTPPGAFFTHLEADMTEKTYSLALAVRQDVFSAWNPCGITTSRQRQWRLSGILSLFLFSFTIRDLNKAL